MTREPIILKFGFPRDGDLKLFFARLIVSRMEIQMMILQIEFSRSVKENMVPGNLIVSEEVEKSLI